MGRHSEESHIILSLIRAIRILSEEQKIRKRANRIPMILKKLGPPIVWSPNFMELKRTNPALKGTPATLNGTHTTDLPCPAEEVLSQ